MYKHRTNNSTGTKGCKMTKKIDIARASDLCEQFVISFGIGVIFMLIGMIGVIIVMLI